MNHLSLFVVGGGHIFVGYIAVFSKGIKCRIEGLCTGEKIASAGMIQFRFQPLPDLLCLEYLNDLLSLDDIPVGGIHAETVNRLIAVVVSNAERPHKRIVIHTFIGRLNTSGSAVSTKQDTSYPQNQAVELSVQLYKMIIVAAEHYIIFVYRYN